MYEQNKIGTNPRTSTLSDAVMVSPSSEVAREHSDLMVDTARLAAVVKELIDKLRPVILAVPTAESRVEEGREGCYSELGNGIREASERLRSETARLRGVLETLAV